MTVRIGYGTERHNAKHGIIVFVVTIRQNYGSTALTRRWNYGTIRNMPVYYDCTEEFGIL